MALILSLFVLLQGARGRAGAAHVLELRQALGLGRHRVASSVLTRAATALRLLTALASPRHRCRRLAAPIYSGAAAVACCWWLGMSLVEIISREAWRDQEALNSEKRHLTMLVDRRVADLEAEVTERTRAEEELRRDGERFSAIIATQRDIATAELDLDAVMDLIVTRTQALTGASGAVLEMAEGDADGLPLRQRPGRAVRRPARAPRAPGCPASACAPARSCAATMPSATRGSTWRSAAGPGRAP